MNAAGFNRFLILALSFTALINMSCGNPEELPEERQAMEQAMNAWSQHDLETYFKIYSPDAKVTGVGQFQGPVGLTELRQYYETLFAAFPDMTLETIDSVAEGQTLSLRFRVKGTHQGDFQGVPPSGRSINVEGMAFFRFEDGKVVERANVFDALGVMFQIGAFSNQP